jgi:hypothetical protein
MTGLDLCTVYVFVRQDIPLAMQLVQSNHATFTMAAKLKPEDGIPNLIVVGVPHVNALRKVLVKLEANAIPSEAFEDSDFDFGMAAVATYPLDAEAKKPLACYRLWRHAPVVAQAIAAFNGEGAPVCNADVAQLREHPVSNGEVAGENPAVSSSSGHNCS